MNRFVVRCVVAAGQATGARAVSVKLHNSLKLTRVATLAVGWDAGARGHQRILCKNLFDLKTIFKAILAPLERIIRLFSLKWPKSP